MIDRVLDPASYSGSALATLMLMVAALSLAVGLWVVTRERGSAVSLSFLASTVALALYQFAFSFMVRAASAEVSMWWGKVAYLGIPFIVPATYAFSVDLLGLRAKRRRIVNAAWFIGSLYAVLAVGTAVLIPSVIRYEWGWVTRLTLWNLPFMFWSLALLALVIRDYSREYRNAHAVQRARIRWLSIPLALASLAFVDYLPSLGLDIIPLGALAFPIYLLSAAWVVARYHLPDLTPAFAAYQVLRTMADPVVVCDLTGQIAFVNRSTERLLNYPEGSLVGRTLPELFGEDQAVDLLFDHAEDVEMTLRDSGGGSIAVQASSSPIRGTRSSTRGVVIVARDIRERKKAAEQLERREQRFRALIENSRETISVLDASGHILYESASVVQLLGYDPESSLGSSIFDRVHADDLDTAWSTFRDLGSEPGGERKVELRVHDASGATHILEVRATNLLEDPAVEGVVINARDITEERQLEAQLQQTQKMEAVGRLAGGVAHDFNNILTAIQGNITLALEEINESSRLRHELEEVQAGAERAARLTDQLLAFSRRQVVRPEVLDVNEVVLGLRSMLERLIGAHIELVAAVSEEPASVRVDRGQIEQVVMNLVVNARDAMRDGGRIVISTLREELDEERAAHREFHITAGVYVRLTVTDDGVGIDPQTLQHIFEPFFTTKQDSHGTGLGLSTVYGIVRQAGGYIGVESERGVGTSFDVYLPSAEVVAKSPDPASPAPEPAPRGTNQTILIVEDEAPVRSLVRRILVRNGYHVIEAEDGAAGLAVARAHEGPLHLLVADLVMPKMAGREMAERLSAERPEMKTLFISGYTSDEVLRQGVVEGEHGFLAKPFTPAALVAKVELILGRAAAASTADG